MIEIKCLNIKIRSFNQSAPKLELRSNSIFNGIIVQKLERTQCKNNYYVRCQNCFQNIPPRYHYFSDNFHVLRGGSILSVTVPKWLDKNIFCVILSIFQCAV